MLGKLLKHEFRATGRVMLPLFGAVLITSALSNLAVRYLDFADNWFFQTLSVIIIVLFAVGVFSLGIVSVVLSVNRFRQSVLGDEGYLTLTLPASIHSVVWSKIIVSAVWLLLCGAVIIGSVYLLAFDIELLHDTADFIAYAFRYFIHEANLETVNYVLIFIEFFVDMCLSLCTVAMAFYAALSVGHGFAQHKMLISVAAFFAISIILSTASSVVMNFIDSRDIFEFLNDVPTKYFPHLISLGGFIYIFVQGAVYYIITVWNLKHRLNLE